MAGRACFEGGNTRLYAYVHNQVPSAATRLDRFLTERGVGPNQRVTVFTDGAGEFEKAVNGASRPTCRILDWFHIAMKFRAIEQTALKYPDMVAPNGRSLHDEIASCKWLVWHGKAARAVTRLRGIHDVLEETAVLRDSALYWNLRRAWWLFEVERPISGQLRPTAPQGITHQQCHCRVGGQRSGQLAHGQEAPDAVIRCWRAFAGASTGARPQRGITSQSICFPVATAKAKP